MPLNRQSYSLLNISGGIMPAKIMDVTFTAGNALAVYTAVMPDHREAAGGLIQMIWYTANVSASQVIAAINALRPAGIGPIVLSHMNGGISTSITV
jgi:hypothetical protein